MVKKILALSLFCFVGLFAFIFASNVYAEENSEQTTVSEKTVLGIYTYTEEKGNAIFKLYSDNTYDAELYNKETNETLNGSGTYIIDGSTLITNVNGETFKFAINGNNIEPLDVTYPCKVVTSLNNGGDILLDIEEGNVGDTVTAYIKPDFLFVISTIQINGNNVEINNDGKYQFQLVEGDNIISVEFKVNNEKLTEIANLVNGVKENGFASLFTVSNLLNLVSWIISVLLSSGFFITLIKSKKLKAKTVDEVVEVVIKTLKTENSKAQLEFLNNILYPILEKIMDKIDNIDDCMKVFCRCFVLIQDDTPENRLAIIEELTKLNSNDEELSNQIRAIVKDEQAKQLAVLEERNKKLDALKESNENIIIEKTTGDSYGQL